MSAFKTLSPVASPGTAQGTVNVIACIGRSTDSDFVVPHALAIGKALTAPVTLLQVLDAQPSREARPDPIEWDVRRHEARKALGGLARGDDPTARAEIALAEGRTVEEICRYANGKAECMLILGRRAEGGINARRIGSTVHNVTGRAPGSILLVPAGAHSDPDPQYKHILVPVDGSPWAESVLPLAVRLAKANGAELILVHIVPPGDLTEIGPPEPEDIQLRARVVDRNERIAQRYLARVKAYLTDTGVRVRTLLRRSDDVRTALVDLIDQEGGDLVVLSARGQGGQHHAGVRYGSVAGYLMAQSPVPLLIVRPPESDLGDYLVESGHLRHPTGARA